MYFSLASFVLLALAGGFTLRLGEKRLIIGISLMAFVLLIFGAADAYHSIRPVGPPKIVASIIWVLIALFTRLCGIPLNDPVARTLQLVFLILACLAAALGVVSIALD